MNRRNFLGALGAVAGVAALGQTPTIREIMFNPPSESPAIYWANGHMDVEHFASGYKLAGLSIPSEQVKHGYATRKLSFIVLYISDLPQENFEPITYWIPGDHEEAA